LHKYPVKNYDGKDAILSTEIIDGKDFSFIAFPETLTVANVVTIYNAVCAYDKAQKDSVKNAAENAAKAKQAANKSYRRLFITTDETVLAVLNAQLAELAEVSCNNLI
jgi:hypothetical protein